ncbi:MAG: hypothetical protein PHQ09_00470 [Actinomycetota bacterium]|nr:hypothetical protein [Actinomycetota bacterium]
MKKIITLTAILSLVIFMLFSASGCKREAAEESVEAAIEEAIESEGGNAEVDISEGETTITTDEGEMTIGQGTDLPDGFPDAIPVYANMIITTSWKTTEDGLEAFSVAASSSDSGSTIFDWYISQLGGWQNLNQFTTGSEEEALSSISADNGTYTLIVTVIETDEGTVVTISVSEIGTVNEAAPSSTGTTQQE